MAVLRALPLFLILVSLLGAPALAQPASERPKIGLVLSGGGARGAAHIGVIKVLEENRIPVDVVVGASFGAIVGGIYATGRTPEELEDILLGLDWDRTLSNEAPRVLKSMRRKGDDESLLIKLRLGIHEGGIAPPRGLILGQEMRLALRDLTMDSGGRIHFDSLPIPFRPVAASLQTGDAVVLEEGNLADAIAASMAIPGLFPPIEIKNQKLVDGGIANNVPMDVARAMGADVLIVVDITSDPSNQEDVDNFLGVLDQMVKLMVYRNAQAQLQTLTDQDVLIVPELNLIGTTDFKNAGRAVPKGREATEDHLAALRRYALSEGEWQAHLETRRLRTNGTSAPVIAAVNVDNDSALSDEVVKAVADIETGKPLDRKELEKDLRRLYGLEFFDAVDYEVVPNTDGTADLNLTATERPGGPDFLRFGLGISDSFDGDTEFNVLVSYTNLGVNSLGGEISGHLQLGDQPELVAEFYQPLDAAQRYFIAAGAQALRDAVLVQTNDGRYGEYRMTEFGGRIGMGRNIGTWGQISAGFQYLHQDNELKSGASIFTDFEGQSASVFAGLEVDTLDNYHFPREGVDIDLVYYKGLEILGGDITTEAAGFNFVAAQHWGRHTLLGTGLVGTTLETGADGGGIFTIGGIGSMSGYASGEVAGPNALRTGMIYYYQIAGHDTALFNTPIYAGVSFEMGNVYDDLDEVGFDSMLYGGSVILGAETMIGPVYLGIGHNTDDRTNAFLLIGQVF